MIKRVNGIAEWNINSVIFDKVNTIYIPNHNGTISVLSYLDQNNYPYYADQLMIMCKISEPHEYGHFVDPDRCRNCFKKTVIHVYDVSNDPYWYYYSDSLHGGELLDLCKECIELSQTYTKQDNYIILNTKNQSTGITKAIIYNCRVIFYTKTIIGMKYIENRFKKDGYCLYCLKRASYTVCCICTMKINKLLSQLSFNLFVILQLPLIKDLQYLLVHTCIDTYQ